MVAAVDPIISSIPAPTREPRRVLLVSPDEDLIEELTDPLEEIGYAVSHQREVELPLEKYIDEWEVDAWIVDGGLSSTPEPGGFAAELPVELHALNIPLLAVIDPQSEPEWRMLRMSSADDFICKPVDLDELMFRLQVLLWRFDSHTISADHPEPRTGLTEFVHYVQADLAFRAQENRTSVLSLAEGRKAWDHVLGGRDSEAESLTEEIYRFFAMNLRRADRLARLDQTRVMIYEPDRSLNYAEISLALLREELESSLGVSLILSLAEFPKDGSSFTALLSCAEEMLARARYRTDDLMSRSQLKSETREQDTIHNILVMTDDAMTVEALRSSIRALGFEVSLATDMLGAGRVMERRPPSLLIVDHQRVEKYGMRWLREMGSPRPGYAPAPVLMLNFPTGEDEVLQSLDSGVKDFAATPIKPREIEARIERILLHRN